MGDLPQFAINDSFISMVVIHRNNLGNFFFITLQKHAYSNILNISPPKTESFQIKILIFFIFLLKQYIVNTR